MMLDIPKLELRMFVSHLMWMLGIKPGSSLGAEVFLTIEPSLQTPNRAGDECWGLQAYATMCLSHNFLKK